ncbi:MAG: PEP-CTERM sorting domain-containing protein [Chthoniobacterales bacterium]
MNLNDQPPAGPDSEDSYTGTYEVHLTAIPEPTTGVLVLATMLAFSFRRRSC